MPAALLACASLVGLPACQQRSPVTIRFAALVGTEEFHCGRSYPGLGTTRSTFTPSDFRFYVSEVKLVRQGGAEVPLELDQDGKWQAKDVALLDFEDRTGLCLNGTPDVNDTLRGRAPEGPYQGIHFTLGVPFALNHDDPTQAPSPLNLSSLFWGWNGGHKFLRIDGKTTGMPGIEIHVGSTGCTPGEGKVSSCARPNRADIRLSPFDPAKNTIVADLAALVATTDLDTNQPDTAPGCMGSATDKDCWGVFQKLGLQPETGAPGGAGQTFFRVR